VVVVVVVFKSKSVVLNDLLDFNVFKEKIKTFNIHYAVFRQ